MLNYNKKILVDKKIDIVIKCPLQLNGWNDMGLATHEWIVAYVLPN